MIEESSVQKHLEIMNGIIDRMSSNSTNCKNWAITIVLAVLLFTYENSFSNGYLLAIIPLLLFYFLDAYYLYLERCFRYKYELFVKKYHSQQLEISDLYWVNLEAKLSEKFIGFLSALLSTATFPFYTITFFMIIISNSFFKG